MNHIRKIKFSCFWLLFLLHHSVYPGLAIAQTGHMVSGPQNITGTPFIENWSYEQYEGAHSQNWTVIQDKRDVLYFGNGDGVLEFDGVNWRLIEFPNQSVASSLAMDKKGRIYVGAENEFGYLAPDERGELKFVSLMPYVPKSHTNFAYIWKTIATSNGVYFVSSRYIFYWNPSEKNKQSDMQIIESNTSFWGIFTIHQKLFVRQSETPLMELDGATLKSAQSGGLFKNLGGFCTLPFGNEKLLILTYESGLFLFDGKSIKPFRTEADDFLIKNKLHHAVELSDGTFAFGTKMGGLVIVDQNGRLLKIINETDGLRNNNIRQLCTDSEGGLWLALNNGISRVQIPSPFTRFGEDHKIKGYIEDIVRHDDRLYVATSSGVYYLQQPTANYKKPVFHQVLKMPVDAWELLVFGNKLLASTGEGIYEIKKGGESKLVFNSFSGVLYASKKYPNLIYVGLSEGIAILQYSAGQWHSTGKLEGTVGSVRTIQEAKDGKLWLGTEQNGVQRIVFGEDFPKIPIDQSQNDIRIEYYDKSNGNIPDEVDIFNYRDQLHFAAEKGLWRFDEEKNVFLPDLSLGAFVADTNWWIGRTVEDHRGYLWLEIGSVSSDDSSVGVLIPQENGTFKWETSPFETISKEDIWLIYPDPKYKGSVWFGGAQGLLKYDPTTTDNFNTDYISLIRKVTIYPKGSSSDSVIFGGTQSAYDKELTLIPRLHYVENSMRFEYAAVSFSDPDFTHYQILLDGFDQDWSDWTKEVKKDYTNLPEGDYVFKVRAKNLHNDISQEANYRFKILPPWWRTWWAYSIYGILILTFLKLIDLYQRKRLIEKEQRIAKEKELIQAKEIEKAYKELKSTQSQLIQSEKMASLGELTAGIAHEIQNPLNFVNNFSDVSIELLDEMNEEIAKGDFDEAKALAADVKQNLEKINHHGKRAEAIVKGMLQHSRSGTGKKEPTNINALADEYFRLAYHGLRAKNKTFNATMETDFDETITTVNVIPQEIGRVILNLITNAFYAVNERSKLNPENYKPTVSVGTKRKGDHIIISVADNGMGIPKTIRDKIFQPFFTTKPTGQGTGLGLSMSYDIITKGHGGVLKVETRLEKENTPNSGKDTGTTFTIELPV